MNINSHTLTLLEFEKIRKSLKEYCFTQEGRSLIAEQDIAVKEDTVRTNLALTDAFTFIIHEKGSGPNFSFPPAQEALFLCEKEGTVLEAQELSAIAGFLSESKKMKNYIQSGNEPGPLLAYAESIPDLTDLSKQIRKYIDKDGSIKEQDIPELRRIRKNIGSLNSEIDATVRNYMNNSRYRNYWQSNTPTQKDGRIVLPMKSNFKGKVEGIIHEVSSSGNTVFIEPKEVVEKNNRLTNLEYEYRQVLTKILRELTEKVQIHWVDVQKAIDVTAFLDTFLARARYAVVHENRRPEISTNSLLINKAKHPLLGKNAVPISVELSEDTKTLIITGPNTGGKTVTLKTVGLLSCMHQFAMHIPVGDGTKLPVFDGIFADIGDEQSLEQSLSTFSGHMITISALLDSSTADSLVLLDELGSGTDPEEGSAIAMAILDSLLNKNATVLATTHHGILKNYGYSKPMVENASVDFDETTLSPTYNIIVGIPGESHAIEIAKRSGLKSEIIDQAREYLKDERNDIAKMIQSLSEKQRELYEKEKNVTKKEETLKEEKRRTDLKELKLKQQEKLLREQGVADISKFLSEARKQLENLVREVREGELTKEKTKKVKQFLENVEEKVEAEEERIDEQVPQTLGEQKEITEGMEVFAGAMKKRGTVLRKAKKGYWIVELEHMKMTLPEEQIHPVPSSENSGDVKVYYSGIHQDASAKYELDLRGMRLEQAINEVELQIDRAVVQGMHEFAIIHGKGEGILQKGIHKYLKSRKEVEKFSFSSPQQGGFGRTEVYLKNE
ncbi:MAG: endonuclease MutS2 [Spirochaetia bacterium]